MDRSEERLQLVLEYTNLSDETDKLHNRDSLSGYDNSELNCLDAIGRLEQPNVTALAGEMRMTKGAISKILRKLSDKDAVEPYQLGSNRQKIFYRLTDAGQELFDAHRERHRGWEERELLFFRSLSEGNCRGPYASSTTTILICVPGWENNNALKIAEERWNDPSLFRFFQGLMP